MKENNGTTIEVKEEAVQHHDKLFKHIDETKFSWFHIKAIIIAGMGFFTDAYDLFIINVVVPMIGVAYFDGKVPVLEETFMKGSAVIGTFLGQVFFGVLSDKLGRKKMYGVELILMIVGTIGSALACNTERGIGVAAMLSFWRLILGIGIGGDYPLSAVITSEYATKHHRGRMIAAVFAMQGVGVLCAAIVSIVVIKCFEGPINADPKNADYAWRICLGLGCVPAIAALYFRLTLPETPRYTVHVEGKLGKAKEDLKKVKEGLVSEELDVKIDEEAVAEVPKASWKDFRHHFSKWNNLRILLGCSLSWFLLDVAFYGLGLNQSIVLGAIGFVPKDATAYVKLYKVATGNAVISLMGTVPGYWATVALVDKLGRKTIQILGFVVLTIIFIILAAGYQKILDEALWLFIVLYCIGLFMFNFGPNTTTFIIPGEVFPTRYRSTGHGISAGSGKLGAILATYGFTPMAKKSAEGVRDVLAIFAVFMFAGLLSTFLLDETKGKTLEELANDSGSPKMELPEITTEDVKRISEGEQN